MRHELATKSLDVPQVPPWLFTAARASGERPQTHRIPLQHLWLGSGKSPTALYMPRTLAGPAAAACLTLSKHLQTKPLENVMVYIQPVRWGTDQERANMAGGVPANGDFHAAALNFYRSTRPANSSSHLLTGYVKPQASAVDLSAPMILVGCFAIFMLLGDN